MARNRERRLRRRLRAAERELAALRADRPIVDIARRYVAEIDQPDIKQPWSIAMWRDWLVDTVRRSRRAA